MGSESVTVADVDLSMKQPPDIPAVDAAPPELLESGHLWILESVVGAPLRFRLAESGAIEFGDSDRSYADADDLPPQYRHAVRHVRTTLDREALRAAVDDPSEIVFFGTAMQYQGLDYDWERTPSFLGTDIWSAATEQFRPPDAVDGIFRRLGIEPINPLDQELPARDFAPDRYEIPQSAWYDGPAAGIVIRDKQGHRASRSNPAVEVDSSPPDFVPETADELAARLGADSRLRRLVDDAPQPPTADQLFERTLDAALRELDPRAFEPTGSVDRRAFRSALAAQTQEFMQNNGV